MSEVLDMSVVDELLSATGGRLLHPTSVGGFAGASVDSRHLVPGSLFVAIPGERTDGHRFIDGAVDAGAVAVLVDRPVELAEGREAALVQVPA